MSDLAIAIRTQLVRQVDHWTAAAAALENFEDFAPAAAWNGVEQYLGLSIRKHLTSVIDRLRRQGTVLRSALDAASSPMELSAARRRLIAFRQMYLRAETTIEFYADAVRTRTNPTLAALLRACDTLAHRSMSAALDQLGKPTPLVLTYIDKGLGASILKAGLRLWDGTGESPAAAVKIVRHNLHRPTSLIHEAGHQVAHIVGWNEELAAALASGLDDAPDGVAAIWASWASEIAADAFAFVHTGYASVAALHDVLAGDEASVLRYVPGDPHPISYLRILLGVEMSRQFGAGLWDDLALVWREQYPFERASASTASLLRASLDLLPRIADLVLRQSMRAFNGRPLTGLVDPNRVSPRALGELEQRLGAALFTSLHWIWTESLRLVALTGLRSTGSTEQMQYSSISQGAWMLRLGGLLHAA